MALGFLIVLVTSLCLDVVNADCQMVGWSDSFKTEARCSSYIRGFMVNGKDNEENIKISSMEVVECCTAKYPWYLSKLQTVYEDWWPDVSFWRPVSCPEGFFLRGLTRPLPFPWLRLVIVAGLCSKPADHPHYYNGNCLAVDISKCTSSKGLCKCPDDYFVAGLTVVKCNLDCCLKELKCCRMWDKPNEFNGMDDVKVRITDITHPDLALLGHYLGYGWAGGCKSPYAGEGYRRVDDTMVADTSYLCEEYKSDQRLNLAYGNWKFELKNITYGERVVDLLNPETIDSVVVVNNDSQPSFTSNVISKTVIRSVTHTTQNSWKEALTLGLKFSYSVEANKMISAGEELSYSTLYEESSTTTFGRDQQDSRQLTATLSKTLEPYSKKKWSVVLSKTRTTLPYTATIIVKFSVDFQGFLRWGGGYNGESTNYHQQYRGSEDRPTIHYQFGDASESFYSALNKQSSRNSPPWQWYQMKAKYPNLQPLIDDLAKESHYEFTLSGKFEDVMGTSIELIWEDLPKLKQEAAPSGSPKYQVLKGLYIARSGVDDVSANVVAPKVVLDNAKLCDFEAPINISTLV